jgi:hypothetical protein
VETKNAVEIPVKKARWEAVWGGIVGFTLAALLTAAVKSCLMRDFGTAESAKYVLDALPFTFILWFVAVWLIWNTLKTWRTSDVLRHRARYGRKFFFILGMGGPLAVVWDFLSLCK